jgi:hypothetical protein
MSKSTPEERADSLVVVDSATPGGPLFVQLTGLPEGPVLFGPYENPNLARKDAVKVRQFLAKVIGEARAEGAALG